MRLLVIGPGYSARAVIARLRPQLDTLTIATRSPLPDDLAALGATAVPFDGTGPSPGLVDAFRQATHVLVSVPPDDGGDPVLRLHSEDLAATGASPTIAYLSTLGVYGDHGGAWIDETAPLRPAAARSVRRVAAEMAWTALGERHGAPVALLRLAGIYGPGRNALASLAAGTAHRVIKPGQVFNRIHVEDIAAAVSAVFAARFHGPVNVADDEPAPPQDVIAYAAALLGVPAPPAVPFAEAALSPMARSFYGENKRASNRLLRDELGVALAFPTYREGLAALLASGRWRSEP